MRSTVVTPVAEVTREQLPAATSVSGNTIHIAGPTKRSVVVPAATLQAPIPVGAATPSSVPSEAPVVTPQAQAGVQEPSGEDAAEETRDRSNANALLITLGVVAAVAALAPAIAYMMGLI